MVVTIHDDDEHLFPALRPAPSGTCWKEQPRPQLVEQLQPHDPGRTASVSAHRQARPVIHFTSARTMPQVHADQPRLPPQLTERENDVLLRVAKGLHLPEIGTQLNPVAAHHRRLRQADLPQAQRLLLAEAALEAQRMGLFERLR